MCLNENLDIWFLKTFSFQQNLNIMKLLKTRLTQKHQNTFSIIHTFLEFPAFMLFSIYTTLERFILF